ncbi:hypothetical protein PR202_gb13698 [Eleusine coracana subsp. coracana]|uniref:Uncharacterized protein n=1 Tax=Eleusine coracana subsp. coracana TaxID=191504 RepID=A0AAV5ESM9_ELECO|nr:hypothetical protein PR202_gb13698 [Eleusine coracana subsp. coracana]
MASAAHKLDDRRAEDDARWSQVMDSLDLLFAKMGQLEERVGDIDDNQNDALARLELNSRVLEGATHEQHLLAQRVEATGVALERIAFDLERRRDRDLSNGNQDSRHPGSRIGEEDSFHNVFAAHPHASVRGRRDPGDGGVGGGAYGHHRCRDEGGGRGGVIGGGRQEAVDMIHRDLGVPLTASMPGVRWKARTVTQKVVVLGTIITCPRCRFQSLMVLIRGLKDSLRDTVQSQVPDSVERAMLLAQIQQEALDRTNSRFSKPGTQVRGGVSVPKSESRNTASSDYWKERQLRDYRRANNLCYFCGDKFDGDHLTKCTKRPKAQLNQLTIEDMETELTESVLNVLEQEELEQDITKAGYSRNTEMAKKSPALAAMNRKFGMIHGLSSLANILAFGSLAMHSWYLASKLDR